MFKALGISGRVSFFCLGGLVTIFSAWGDRRNCWVMVCEGGTSTQADTMGVGWKEGHDLFEEGGGCNFCVKNKLKSEIFNDKKCLWTKIFFLVITKNSNWKILTKNLVTFKSKNGFKDEKLKNLIFRGKVLPYCTLYKVADTITPLNEQDICLQINSNFFPYVFNLTNMIVEIYLKEMYLVSCNITVILDLILLVIQIVFSYYDLNYQ